MGFGGGFESTSDVVSARVSAIGVRMYRIALNCIRWLLQKGVLFVFILLGLLLVFLASHLADRLRERTLERMNTARVEIERLEAHRSEFVNRVRSTVDDIKQKEAELRKVQQRLKQLEEFWEWIKSWGEGESERQRRIEAEKQAALELGRSIFALKLKVRDLEEAMEASEALVAERKEVLTALESEFAQNLEMEEDVRGVVREGIYGVLPYALVAFAGIVCTPLIFRLVLYWCWAPLIERCKPVRLTELEDVEEDDVQEVVSKPALEARIESGECLLVREKYLQSSDENSRKRTQFFMHSRYPFTSLIAGLFLMTRIELDQDVEDGCSVRISGQSDEAEELAEVVLRTGERLVIHPSFVAALMFPADRSPKIRSRWVFGRVQSWLTLRFRYLLIEGPVRIFFVGSRGIQQEQISGRVAGRRINSRFTVAFEPHLSYSARRAETFLSYFRGANSLFDDFYSGSGRVFTQQVWSLKSAGPSRFWESMLNAVGKVFGI